MTYKEALQQTIERIEENLSGWNYICPIVQSISDKVEYAQRFQQGRETTPEIFKGDFWHPVPTKDAAWWNYYRASQTVIGVRKINKVKIKYLKFLINTEDD